MIKKLLLTVVFAGILTNIFSQENDNYLVLLNELNSLVNNNFISPFRNNDVRFINDNYWGFGYKRNIFTGQIKFSNIGVILCNMDEDIYSMTDGVITKIGYDENPNKIIIIQYGKIEIHYLLVEAININEGDIIKRGQLIGKIKAPYYSRGPALELRLKYKTEYFDPYLFLYEIIQRNDI
jgi:murein DD-endopeptidase MepM/ murein hydrolase activator NlpD